MSLKDTEKTDKINENEQIEHKDHQQGQTKMMKGAATITLLMNFIKIWDLVVVIYASTLLTLTQIGLYNLLLQYIPFLTMIINYGMINTINKLISQHDFEDKKSISAGITYKIILFNTSLALFFTLLFLFNAKDFSRYLTNVEDYDYYIKLIAIQVFFIPELVFNQFLVARYEFRSYFIANFTGHVIRLICVFYLLTTTRDIAAYFLSNIIGQGLIYVLLLGYIFKYYRKPDFSYPFKKIFIYATPLFLSQFLIYLKSYIYNLIFYHYFQDLQQMGLLYYITVLFNLIMIPYNSLNNVLTIQYSKIIYHEEAKRLFKEFTFQLSRFYVLFSNFIALFYLVTIPFIMKELVLLFNSEHLYSIGTITAMLFGIYFFINMFYYIAPSIIHLYEDSTILLKIHFFNVLLYIISYLIFIPMLGLPGIPIARSLGFASFILICRYIIKKSFEIGFDKKMFKKILLIFIPLGILILFIYVFTSHDTNYYYLTLFGKNIAIATHSLLVLLGSYGFILVYMILAIRKWQLFSKKDKGFFTSLFGKNKISEKIINLLIKQ